MKVGMNIKLYGANSASVPTLPTIAQDFCPCLFKCEFVEQVFAGTNDYNSDYSDFLFRKIGPSDTVVIELQKAGVTVATISDSTYGEYNNGFPNASKYVGWLADWTAIYGAFGGGLYQVKATLTILGSSYTLNSRKFMLKAFHEILAANTIRIETYQTGPIFGDEFDYSLIAPWYSSIRLNGSLIETTPTLEVDKYLNSNNELIQNREKTIRKFRIELPNIEPSVAEMLIKNKILANQLIVSEYIPIRESALIISLSPENFEEYTSNFDGRGTMKIAFRQVSEQIKTNV